MSRGWCVGALVLCPLWGWRMGVPGGGALHHCEGRLVLGAGPPPAARPLERAAGVPRPVCPGCVRRGCGDPHRPHSVRLCGPALLAVRVAEGCPGVGRLPPLCEGRLRSGAVPPPTARLLGGLLGSATHVLWARPCGCGSPTLSPWPACPVGAACRGGGEGLSLGGVACHRWEGRLVSGAVPPPVARPLEWAARIPRPVCPGCGRCGRGDPAPAPQRAPLRAGVARCGGGGRASSEGVACHLCEGRLVSGAVPPPAARPLERAARVPRPVCPGCGRCGRGDPAPAPQRAPLRAGVARCGGGGRASPGGVPSTIPPGASEVRRCPSPDCPPTGRAVGVRHSRAVGAGVWVWGPNTVPLSCMPCGGCVPRGWWGAGPWGGGLPPL